MKELVPDRVMHGHCKTSECTWLPHAEACLEKLSAKCMNIYQASQRCPKIRSNILTVSVDSCYYAPLLPVGASFLDNAGLCQTSLVYMNYCEARDSSFLVLDPMP